MYTQEIKCPGCGKLTRVNVCDGEGKAITPCGVKLSNNFFLPDDYCNTKIVVITDKSGNVIEIRKKGFLG
jgi:hypothetical protein